MSPKFQKRSALKFVGRIILGAKRRRIMTLADNETQSSETKCTEACWTNYPRSEAIVTPAESEWSEARSAGGTIPPT